MAWELTLYFESSSSILKEAGRQEASERVVTWPEPSDRKAIGWDIKTAQYGWPIVQVARDRRYRMRVAQ